MNSLRSAEDAGIKYLAFPGRLLSGLEEPQLKMKPVAYGFFSLMSQSNGQHRHAELLELCVSNTRHAKICLSSFLGDAHLRIIMYILLKMPFFFFFFLFITSGFTVPSFPLNAPLSAEPEYELCPGTGMAPSTGHQGTPRRLFPQCADFQRSPPRQGHCSGFV